MLTPANVLCVNCACLLLFYLPSPFPTKFYAVSPIFLLSPECQAYSHLRASQCSLFAARNLFLIYLHGPLPHFIHVSAQKALIQKCHPWPLFITVIIISGTRHYVTTISALLWVVIIHCWHYVIYLFIHFYQNMSSMRIGDLFVLLSASSVACNGCQICIWQMSGWM